MSESSLFPTALDSTNIYEVVARLSTTLTADITAATTTIPLASTTGFPTKGNIVIDNETIAYISVAVGSVDATGGRGKAGTAASHLSTTQVLYAVTATDFNKLRAGLIAVQTKVGISGSTDTATLTGVLSGITGSPAIATGAEVTTGTNNTKIVTPKAIGDAKVMARAYLSSAQLNLTDSVWTKILLDLASYDTGSTFDAPNRRFVAPATGYYQINATMIFEAATTGKRYYGSIYINGALYSKAHAQTGAADLSVTVNVVDICYVVAGQYIELYALSNSGNNTVDLAAGTDSTYMSIHLLNI